MADTIQRMDIEAFRDQGYLHEVNRQLLHPMGLALEVSGGWTKDDLKEALEERGYQYGQDALDNAWATITLFGLDRPFISSVWDYRDDPEGMRFGDDTLSPEKAANFAKLWGEREEERREALGYMVQPVE